MRLNSFHITSRWLGHTSYHVADKLQKQLEQERRNGKRGDSLICLEHPHVYTLGRSARERDILVDDLFLKKMSVAKVMTDRGGKVTYHGPGQLVGYLIMDLRARKLSIPSFVWLVEEGLRRWLQLQGIAAERRVDHPGLWYRGQKLASLGFHISRGISRHGFALNIQPELCYFNWIVPCGERTQVTSVEQLLQRRLAMRKCAREVGQNLSKVFSCYGEVLSSLGDSSGVSSS